MAKIRLYPHRTAAQDSVLFREWWIERGGRRVVLPTLLQGWDYASEEIVGIVLSIDHEALLESTGHQALDELELILIAECAAAQRRITARHPLTGRDTVTDEAFEMVLPAGQLADSIQLEAHVIVSDDLGDRADRVATDRGARLASSEPRKIILEGEASRFPVEPAPFSELGYPNAPWTLHLTFADLDSSFMGSVRLLVNSEHPVGRMLLDAETAPRVSGLAMADVIRLLVATIAEHGDEAWRDEYEGGTVGQVVDWMCDFYLQGDLRSAVQMYQQEPLHFDRVLHDGVMPLAKVFGP